MLMSWSAEFASIFTAGWSVVIGPGVSLAKSELLN
jgi:hypothetical protein